MRLMHRLSISVIGLLCVLLCGLCTPAFGQSVITVMIDKTSSAPGVRLSPNDRKRLTNHIFNAVVSGVESPSVNVLRVDDLTRRAKRQGKNIRKCLKRLKNCRRTVFAQIGADYIVQSKVDQEPSSSAYQLRVELYKVGRFDSGHKQVVGAWTDTASSPRGLTSVAGVALAKIVERLRAIDRRRSGLELTDERLTAGELALKARASRLERRRRMLSRVVGAGGHTPES